MFHITNTPQKFFAILSAAALSASLATPVFACGTPDSVYTGSVCVTAASFCPRGYLQANGQILPISQYQALFSLLGTAYGGDGRASFGIPDLRGRSIAGVGQGPGLSQVLPGQKRGREAVVQSIAQMPQHTHAATATEAGSAVTVTLSAKQVAGQNIPEEGYLLGAGGSGPSSASVYVEPSTPGDTVNLGGVEVSTSGGSISVDIGTSGASNYLPTTPPQLGLRYCIALEGIYPSRPD